MEIEIERAILFSEGRHEKGARDEMDESARPRDFDARVEEGEGGNEYAKELRRLRQRLFVHSVSGNEDVDGRKEKQGKREEPADIGKDGTELGGPGRMEHGRIH